jgi:hypothetical protein
MANPPAPQAAPVFRVFILSQGAWGERIADNLEAFCPADWQVRRWKAPAALPLIIDDGLDFLPAELPPADLILSVGDTPGVAQLVPDAVRLTGARAVIAPIDRTESLPPGLARQLRGWLAVLDVPVVFPKPFCSLTETTVNLPPIVEHYDNALIRRFAHHFGRPELILSVAGGRVGLGVIARDSACGCAHHVISGLAGQRVDDAEHEAGMLHHHFPCLAGMTTDPDYGDTLMHVSGNLLRRAVRAEVADHVEPAAYWRPHGYQPPDVETAPPSTD